MKSKLTDRMRVHSALARIRNVSRFYAAGWKSSEAALIWTIYAKSVVDHFMDGNAWSRLSEHDKRTAAYTVHTGMIVLPNGESRNVLELLHIDPEWARRQIEIAFAYVEDIAA